MKLTSKTLSHQAPRRGVTAYEFTHYTRPSGTDKMRVRFLDISDDIFDSLQISFSTDNGKTWPESKPILMAQKTPEGTLRRCEDATFVDPVNGRLVNTYLEGLFRNDSAAEGFSTHRLKYRVSDDGGRTSLVDEPVVGKGYTAEHPFAFVWYGKNAFSNAGQNSIVRTSQGHLVLVTTMTVLGPDGDLSNPGGGYGWFEVAVLIGRWQPDARIEWESAARIALGPHQSTRGIFEPTIAQMPDGRLLLVMRASNGWGGDPQCKLPSHKWHSVSTDGGFTWTAPQPWRYTDGTAFFSPSSISQLLRHSNGKLYWFGNISDQNCRANNPRHPLVIAEVDPRSLMLRRESQFIVEDRQPGDPDIQLSNFSAHEDRVTHEIVLNLPRYVEQDKGVWGGDTHEYRIRP